MFILTLYFTSSHLSVSSCSVSWATCWRSIIYSDWASVNASRRGSSRTSSIIGLAWGNFLWSSSWSFLWHALWSGTDSLFNRNVSTNAEVSWFMTLLSWLLVLGSTSTAFSSAFFTWTFIGNLLDNCTSRDQSILCVCVNISSGVGTGWLYFS